MYTKSLVTPVTYIDTLYCNKKSTFKKIYLLKMFHHTNLGKLDLQTSRKMGQIVSRLFEPDMTTYQTIWHDVTSKFSWHTLLSTEKG